MTIQYTILHSVSLDCECMLTNTYDVLGELESTRSQIIVIEYEYMDGVSFNYGGGNNLLRKLLGNCIRYMKTLCTTWTTKLTGYFAITGKCHPLPSYCKVTSQFSSPSCTQGVH